MCPFHLSSYLFERECLTGPGGKTNQTVIPFIDETLNGTEKWSLKFQTFSMFFVPSQTQKKILLKSEKISGTPPLMCLNDNSRMTKGEKKNCLKIFLFNSLMEIDRHFFLLFFRSSINKWRGRQKIKGGMIKDDSFRLEVSQFFEKFDRFQKRQNL